MFYEVLMCYQIFTTTKKGNLNEIIMSSYYFLRYSVYKKICILFPIYQVF
jgi:hypothetical protein